MAAATHKLIMTFAPNIRPPNAQNTNSTVGSQQGWSESWYRNVVEEFPAILPHVNTLFLARRALLTPGWRIKNLRVTVWPNSREAQRYKVPPQDGRGTYGTNFNERSENTIPSTALILNLVSSLGVPRNFDLRGIGADVVTANLAYDEPAIFAPLLAAYINALKTSWAIKKQSNPGEGGVIAVSIQGTPPTRVTPVTPLVQVNIVTQLPVIPPPVAGQYIRITGTLGIGLLNGLWRIESVRPTNPDPGAPGTTTYSVSLAQKRRVKTFGSYVEGGRAKWFGYALDPIAGGTPGDGTTRRTGSVFPKPRGRRSNRTQ